MSFCNPLALPSPYHLYVLIQPGYVQPFLAFSNISIPQIILPPMSPCLKEGGICGIWVGPTSTLLTAVTVVYMIDILFEAKGNGTRLM